MTLALGFESVCLSFASKNKMQKSEWRRAVVVTALLAVPIVWASSIAGAQSTCSAAFKDSVSTRTVDALSKVAAVPPVWDDYTFSRHPLLLLSDSSFRGQSGTPVCAALWHSGAPLELIELAVRPPFSTPLYGMINSDSVGPRAIEGASDLMVVRQGAPSSVTDVLRSRGITRVVVLNVPMNFDGLGRLGEMLKAAHADPAPIQADLAVHESFHLHSQFPTWLGQSRTYVWPAWDQQPNRVELRKRCYAGSPELSAALKSEIQALLAAYDAVALDSSTRDVAGGVREARRFVELRAVRRKLQDTISVAQGQRRISCEMAEDLMELEEGATQWIGHATSERAGLTTAATLRTSYSGSQAEVFYQLGPLQLWILDGLLGHEQLRRITAQIARSTGPKGPRGGVHAQFEYQTRLLKAAF